MKQKVFLTIALLCAIAQEGWAGETLTYINRTWDGDKKELKVETGSTSDYVELQSSDGWVEMNAETSAWYVVKGNVSIKVLKVTGNVNLLLCDNARLETTHIKLERGQTWLLQGDELHIYAQQGESGQLISTATETGWAGIGGGSVGHGGMLHVHGGYVEAHGGKYAAGIGGGDNGYASEYFQYGGEVKAYGGNYGAGIGSGDEPKVTYINAQYGRDIQGGACIYSGKLRAEGGTDAAGIGGGNEMQGTNVEIWGGEVIAKGSSYAAGIGTGDQPPFAYPCDIKIHGGTVWASGGDGSGSQGSFWGMTDGGAGIGSGYAGDGCNIYIDGGTIFAEGGKNAPGIGISRVHSYGYLNISGGNITAKAGEDWQSSIRSYRPSISNLLRVDAGNDATHLTPALCAERYEKMDGLPFATIRPCTDHEVFTYVIDDESTHTATCSYCGYSVQQQHTTQDCPCGIHETVRKKFTLYVPGDTKGSYVEAEEYEIGAGKEFYLPDCTTIPDGYVFKGWEMNPDPETLGDWAADVGYDMKEPGTPVQSLLGQGDATFYARYLYDIKDEWTWEEDYSTVLLTLSSAAFDYDKHYTTQHGVTISSETRGADRFYVGSYTYKENGYEYPFSSVQKIASRVRLRDGEDNSAVLSLYDDQFVGSVMLQGRDLYIDGSWNTICLPFEVSAEKVATMLENPSALKKLKSSSFENGVLTLNFEDATYISAGVPYLIKWDVTGPTIGNPAFDDVTIVNTTETITKTAYVDFVGSFSPVDLKANDRTVLYLGAGNTLYYPSDDMTVGACRGIFRLKGDLTAGEKAGARAFVLNFGHDEATGILSTTNYTNFTNDTNSDAWYDLQGRRISVPSASSVLPKGLYINNGKKVVIK